MMYHPITFGCKQISSSVDVVERVIFDYMNPHCDPQLEDSKPIFLLDFQSGSWCFEPSKPLGITSGLTLCPFMMHHHTMFGYRRFSSQGDIVQMNSHWNFSPFPWPSPWPQHSKPICLQDNHAYDMPSNQDWLQKDQQFRKYKVIFWLYDPSLWPWPWRQQTNLFGRQSGSRWCITIPCLVVKGSAIQKISGHYIFIDILKFCCGLDLEHNNPISP